MIKYYKMFFVVNVITLLSGCYYKNNCIFSPQSVYCMEKKVSDFDRYSKINISLKQKQDDIKQCGGSPDKYGNIFESLRKANPGGNGEWLAVRAFDNCMKSKGYRFTE